MESRLDFKNVCESQKKLDKKKGAHFVPLWVDRDRLKGDHVWMNELEYWVNYTNPVPLDRKLTEHEWVQVKVFNLPKKTLKLQVDAEHLDVFLSTVKAIKPRRDHHKNVRIIIKLNEKNIFDSDYLYGRFDHSRLNQHFRLIKEERYGNFDCLEYKFKNKYYIKISKDFFSPDQRFINKCICCEAHLFYW